MKKYADQGITHLITFSCTHFRWTFKPWWKEINQCLAKIVCAAHKQGLKIIEHHSSELASYPNSPENLERLRKGLLDRGSSLESWPGLLDYLTGPDSPALQWAQINEKTLLPHVAGYAATSRCYNNPEYVCNYLNYLETVYATGVDGIMTDDVQYYCHCQCEHCKQLFKEKYQASLPPHDQWEQWCGDMRDPSFIKWLHFRFDSTAAFHQKVKNHYDKLGMKLLRPNYVSLALTRDWTAACVETVPQMDWFFQECARSCVIRYSWLKSLSEQKHRSMVAKQRGIPHGILFYAYNRDQLIFSWAISLLAGAFYINTPEGGECELDESEVRSFEKKYASVLFNVEEMAEVGFLDHRENRFFAAGYEMSRMEFWMQACILNNIPCLLLDANAPDTWKKCQVICLNELHLLSKNQIEALQQFAHQGGCLVISGVPGSQVIDGRERTLEECEELWKIPFRQRLENEYMIIPTGLGKICLLDMHFAYPGSQEELQTMFGQNHMNFRFGKMPFELLKQAGFVCANTLRSENKPTASSIAELYEGLQKHGKKVASLLLRCLGKHKRAQQRLSGQIPAKPLMGGCGR
ncbi:MAG: hypothetical protein PHT43_06635, partial [Anaerolineaceae bacterium]|nr:hypothetical protein [Anaerolineaceae bacterium]